MKDLNIWRHLKAAIAFDFASAVRKNTKWASQELLQRVQILNRQHAHLAQEQVLSSVLNAVNAVSMISLIVLRTPTRTPTLLHPELLMPRQTHRADGINLLREYSVANGPLARCWCQILQGYLIQSHQMSPATCIMLHHVGSIWIQDGCLNMRCKLTLPFNGAFAHVVHMPGLSAATGQKNVEWTWAACHLGYPLFILYNIYIYIYYSNMYIYICILI